MKLFGIRVVLESKYQELIKSQEKINRLAEVYRWFSGWTDLDIIWNYIFKDSVFGGICKTRDDYANARKTDVYGKPTER